MSRRDNASPFPAALVRELERVVREIPPEAQWTVKTVGEELISAIRLCNRAVGRVLPRGAGAAWPTILRDWGDLIAQVETDEVGNDDQPRRFSATREQINRMERALIWQARYLTKPEHQPLRQILAVWLRTKARRGGSFDHTLKKLGIARATAYRARDRALLIIAIGLMKDGITP